MHGRIHDKIACTDNIAGERIGENFGSIRCSRAGKSHVAGDGSKVLEQARLEKQKPHVDSSLKQVADTIAGDIVRRLW